MGNVSICCKPIENEQLDMNFKSTTEKLDNGSYKTMIINTKGDNLHLFCDYGTLKFYNVVNDFNPLLADKTFYFLSNEIIKMNDYFIKNSVHLENILFYKVEFYGINTELNGLKDSKSEFYLNGECFKDRKKQLMIYTYKSSIENGLPQQMVKFIDV